MSKLSEIFNREIDLIKKDENTLGIVLVGSSKDLDFEKDIKINDIDLFIFTKEQELYLTYFRLFLSNLFLYWISRLVLT